MRKLALILALVCMPKAYGQVQPTPMPKTQFLGSTGQILPSGCLFTYTTGTTTPLATYTDSTGGTPNTNPVILDSAGRADVWLTNGSVYRLKLVSAGGVNCASGVQQWQVDGITNPSLAGILASNNTWAGNQIVNGNLTENGNTALNTLTVNGAETHNAAETHLGNNTHSGTETFDKINNILFIGGPTYAASAAGINAAIQALPSTGGKIVLPQGVTQISSTIVIDRPVYMVGQSQGFDQRGTVLQWTGGASTVITLTTSTASNSYLKGFDINNTGSGTIGIDIDNNAILVKLEDIYINPSAAFTTAGIRVGNSTGVAVTNTTFINVVVEKQVVGLLLLKNFGFTCNMCKFDSNSTNDVQLGDATHQVIQARFESCDIESGSAVNGATNIKILNASGIDFQDCFGENFGAGYWLDIPNTATLADGIVIRGGYFTPAGGAPAFFSNVNFSGATFSIQDAYTQGYPAASVWVRNQSSRRIWLNNLMSDTTNIGLTSSNTNVSFGPTSAGSALTGPYTEEAQTFRNSVTIATLTSTAAPLIMAEASGAPSGSAGNDLCWADSTAHELKCSSNNSSAGILHRTVASTGAVTIGSGSSIAATSLCSTAVCGAGRYRIDLYIDITTACTTTGSYIVWLGYTDDQGAKTGSSTTTYFSAAGGLGVTPATSSAGATLVPISTADFMTGSYTLTTTGAATGGLGSINYGTTATACGTGGPMVGKMYLDVTRLE